MTTKLMRFLWLALAAAVALGGWGCGKTPPTNFYTINYAAASGTGVAAAASSVGVDRPRASQLLRQDRIVYFTAGNELNFYQYHRWADPPPFRVQALLVQQLQSAGLFENVTLYRAQKNLDYVLRGELLAMEEVDTATAVTARFGLALELVRQKDSRVVWSGRARRDCPVTAKTVPAVVEAMNGCVQQSLEELTRSLGDAVATLPSKQGTGQ